MSRTQAVEAAQIALARKSTRAELQAIADKLAAEMQQRLAQEAQTIISSAVSDVSVLGSRFTRLSQVLDSGGGTSTTQFEDAVSTGTAGGDGTAGVAASGASASQPLLRGTPTLFVRASIRQAPRRRSSDDL